MKTLAFNISNDPNTPFDLIIKSNSLQMKSDGEAVAQAVLLNINTTLGEYFLDVEHGVDWFGKIFVDNFNKDIADAEITRAVINTTGVSEIIKFESQQDSRRRRYEITALWIKTIYDTDEVVL